MYDIKAAAGDGRTLEGGPVESVVYFETDALHSMGLAPAEVVGVKVPGDSMGSTLEDGDRVLVDRSQRKLDGVFLVRIGDERPDQAASGLPAGATC
ncbi:S24 family peptidase [Halomonas sp. BC04]|uniref:S24 family peptidase n=1 Tax=Halomonas sp. BC04 TaxID=1403540 RepID=UPI001E2F0655|nr:S24 family peptidase [Halomonas sp. BC04]